MVFTLASRVLPADCSGVGQQLFVASCYTSRLPPGSALLLGAFLRGWLM